MASIGKSPPPAKHPEQLGSHEARDNTTDTRDTGDAIEAAGPTSTPLPDAGHVSGPSEPARIRRNTACVRCRDAKVRCNASTATGRPCLRCSKLELQCVVDKSHKRTSRRSKLEELAAEVQNIKEAVAPRALVDVPSGLAPARRASLPPPALSSVPAQLPSHGPASHGLRTAPPPAPPPEQHYIPAPSSAGAFKFGRPRPFSISGETAIPPSTPVRTNDVLSAGSAVQLAEPRALGSRVFSGEDIDYYFGKYFEHFHAYLPIVRTRDPDTCYRRGPVLFWAIIMTACRRFARDDTAFQFLIDSLLPLIWCSVSQPPLHLSIINAILLLATWPFPTIRFLTDPSLIFAGIAMNSSFLTGLHTGRGSHSEFKSAMHELDTTDEEATFTWVGCAIISHRVSAYMGCPSASSLFNKTVDDLLDGRSQFSLPRYFYLHLETSRFANRVNRTMCASLEESHGVSHHLVAYMEEEYAKVQRLLYPDNSDLDNFTLLSTLLEIQTYYFMPLPGYSEELLKRNVIKCYCTAEELIHSATRLHRETAFLHYAPHFVFRTLLSSICVVMSVHLSSYTKGFQADTVGPLIKEALRAIRICSVQDNDLHVRCGGMLEKYWEMKAHIPRSDSGVSVYTHRLGASLTFDCLRRWKKDVEQARDANGLGFANGGSKRDQDRGRMLTWD
ncbi:putative transcription factor [Cladorrhinum samala]|uniref:Transcription factor n=1 Tax=Cladorrhinum samala TaxID=585594 RepID=A0AAV9HI80_9PEZI|nr:putative transcription factor [Cladorrhinum samala]